MDITPHPSANFGERRGGVSPDLVVLHYTAMGSVEAALARLCDPDHEVSAHYLISEIGEIFQLVNEENRAWHAGAGAWGGCGDVNSASIGIELANDGVTPFAAVQIDVLVVLIADIMTRWSIPAERVIGHSDMAPGRKTDPGRRFDWRRLALSGVSVWPDVGAEIVPGGDGFLARAHGFGYPTDCGEAAVLQAFRLRFCPWKQGPVDGADIAMLAALEQQFPVDQAGASA